MHLGGWKSVKRLHQNAQASPSTQCVNEYSPPHSFPQFKNMHRLKIKLYRIIWPSHLFYSCKIIPLLLLA